MWRYLVNRLTNDTPSKLAGLHLLPHYLFNILNATLKNSEYQFLNERIFYKWLGLGKGTELRNPECEANAISGLFLKSDT